MLDLQYPSSQVSKVNSFIDVAMPIPSFPDEGVNDDEEGMSFRSQSSVQSYLGEDDDSQTYVTDKNLGKFDVPNLTVDQKIGILSSDSVLIPILIGKQSGTLTVINDNLDESAEAPFEVKQAYLVHLQISKMAVTVHTSEDFIT